MGTTGSFSMFCQLASFSHNLKKANVRTDNRVRIR